MYTFCFWEGVHLNVSHLSVMMQCEESSFAYPGQLFTYVKIMCLMTFRGTSDQRIVAWVKVSSRAKLE